MSTPFIARLRRNLTGKRHSRRGTRRGSGTRRLQFEEMEPRVVLSTIIVNSLMDAAVDWNDGHITLRDATALASDASHVGPDDIIFADSLDLRSAPHEITLTHGQITIDSDVTIQGPGADLLTVSAGYRSRVLNVNAGVDATIQNISFSSGSADLRGGAIYNSGKLSLVRTIIRDSRTRRWSSWARSYDGGGGVFNEGDLLIAESVVQGNYTGDQGGGIYNFGTGSGKLKVRDSRIIDNGARWNGGGIYGQWGGVVVTNSVIAGNSADGGGGMTAEGDTFVANTTIFDNSSRGKYGDGGGIELSSGNLHIVNSTIANNVASDLGGGVYNNRGVLRIHNSITATNSAGTGRDIYGTYFGEHNLIGEDPLFVDAPHGDYQLRDSSPAIDAGNILLAQDYEGRPLEWDARGYGYPRRLGMQVDIGAYEKGVDRHALLELFSRDVVYWDGPDLDGDGSSHEMGEGPWQPGDDADAGLDFDTGYIVDAVFDDPATDFFGLGLVSTIAGQSPILVLRGTAGVGGFVADFNSHGVGRNQFIKNWNNEKDGVKKWLEDMSSSARVDVIGHSLGGALAQWIASTFTAEVGRLGEVVTFNSPGIAKTEAETFRSARTLGATHYVTSGDVASMAGTAFIDGTVRMANYKIINSMADLLPWEFAVRAHVFPVVIPWVREAEWGDESHEEVRRLRPSELYDGDLRSASHWTYPAVDDLNSPWFMYRDYEYLGMLAGWSIALATISEPASSLASLPAMLVFRSTTESSRAAIGGVWDTISIVRGSGDLDRFEIRIPKLDVNLLGWMRIRGEDLYLKYESTPSQRFFFQGLVSLPGFFNASADFTGDNYIEVRQNDWDLVGEAAIEDVDIGGWVLEDAQLAIDTRSRSMSGSAKLRLPSGKSVEAGLGFENGRLNRVSVGVDNLSIPIGDTGAFFQSINGYLDNISNGEGLVFGIKNPPGIGVTYGPQITVDVPFFLPWDDFTGSLVRGSVGGEIDSSHVALNGEISVLGGLATGDGGLGVDWNKGQVAVDGHYRYLGGTIVTDMALKASQDLNIKAWEDAVIQVPDGVPRIAGCEFASAHAYFQFMNDAKSIDWTDPSKLDTWFAKQDWDNDFIAGWGTFNGATLGFKLTFGGDWEWIGAGDLPEKPGAGEGEQDVPAMGNFEIPSADLGWAILEARWDNAVGDIAIQIRKPDGTIVDEKDFDGQELRILNNSANDATKAVYITSPDPGDWTLIVPDTTGLGTVTFAALQEKEINVPTVAMDGPLFDVQANSVPIDYTVANADSDTRIAVFYDDDRSGYDGQMIAEFPVGDGSGSYQWNVQSIPTGNYYVYASVIGGDSIPSSSGYSAGAVQVVDPLGPPPIIELNAPEATDTSMRLTWAPLPSDQIDHYIIRIADDPAGQYYRRTLGATGPGEVVIDSLEPDATYRVAVAAVNREGHVGPDSEPIIVDMPGATAPTDWNVFAVPGTTYQEKVPGTESDLYVPIELPNGATLGETGEFQWNVPTDAVGWYRVTVHVMDANENVEVCRRFVLVDNSSPMLSNTVAPSGKGLSSTTIQVHSPDAIDKAGVLRYQLERDGVPLDDWMTTPSIVDGGIQPNTQHTYRIKAADSSPARHESSWTESFLAWTLAETPGAPSIGDVTDSTIIITGLHADANPAGTEYAIFNATTTGYVGADGSRSKEPVWRPADEWTNTTVSELSPDTEYEFHALARNGNGMETPLGQHTVGRTARESVSPTVDNARHANKSFTVRFSEPVVVSKSDITLLSAADDQVDLSGATLVPDSPGSTWIRLDVADALVPGTYRLVLNGESIQDMSANLLDGNGDGAGGDDFVYAFRVSAAAPTLDLDADDSTGQNASDYAATFVEDSGPLAIADVDAEIADADSTQLTMMTVTVSNRLDGRLEVLTADTSGTDIHSEFRNGVLILYGTDSVSAYEQVLRTVHYENLSQNPNDAIRNIEVVVDDGVKQSNTATSAVTIVPVNDAPNAVPDDYTCLENDTLFVGIPGLLSNDGDVDDDKLEFVLVQGTAYGTLGVGDDGSFSYTPTNNFNREDGFTYKLTDGTVNSDIVSVDITMATQYPWHNGTRSTDVNDDTTVVPLDALLVINSLNQDGSHQLPSNMPHPLQPPFYDVNRDGFVSPLDALIVINDLNRRAGGGEGEADGHSVSRMFGNALPLYAALPHSEIAGHFIHVPKSTGRTIAESEKPGATHDGDNLLPMDLLNPTTYHRLFEWETVEDQLSMVISRRLRHEHQGTLPLLDDAGVLLDDEVLELLATRRRDVQTIAESDTTP